HITPTHMWRSPMSVDALPEAPPSEGTVVAERSELAPLRQRGLLSWARGRDGAGLSRLIIEPAAGASPALAGRALDQIADAHAAVRSPFVPGVAAHIPGTRLALACDPVTDLEEVMAWVTRGGHGLPYIAGIALNEVLMDAVEAAHQAGQFFGALGFA